MTRTIDANVVRDETFVKNDLLIRAIAGAIIAEALQMAAHCQVNRVHRAERFEDLEPSLANELSGKTILDVTKWRHGWMLSPRPEGAMRKGIYQQHQETVSRAVTLALRSNLLSNLPFFGVKAKGEDENFELLVCFA